MVKAYFLEFVARLEEVEGHLARGLEHPESSLTIGALAAFHNDQ
jgi:hypothetical protein